MIAQKQFQPTRRKVYMRCCCFLYTFFLSFYSSLPSPRVQYFEIASIRIYFSFAFSYIFIFVIFVCVYSRMVLCCCFPSYILRVSPSIVLRLPCPRRIDSRQPHIPRFVRLLFDESVSQCSLKRMCFFL